MRKIDRMLARLPFAPIVAALFAVVAVVLIIATPQWLFERWVTLSGIAEAMPSAAPPLGNKARIAAAMLAGAATGGILWLALTFGERLLFSKPDDEDVETEGLNGASGRGPIFAGNELGAPLMSDEAMAQARDELVLDAPLEDVVDVAVATETPEPRLELVETMQIVPVRRQPVSNEGIPALLDRLDAAIGRKAPGYRPDRSDLARLRKALGR